MPKNKILVIDDNDEMRDMLHALLSIKGYTVETSETGVGVQAKLSEVEPDLIICDIAMPEKDGFGVLEDVRASETHAELPFVFLTASMLQSEEEKIVSTSANGYLMKPYESKKLFELLDKLLSDDES